MENMNMTAAAGGVGGAGGGIDIAAETAQIQQEFGLTAAQSGIVSQALQATQAQLAQATTPAQQEAALAQLADTLGPALEAAGVDRATAMEVVEACLSCFNEIVDGVAAENGVQFNVPGGGVFAPSVGIPSQTYSSIGGTITQTYPPSQQLQGSNVHTSAQPVSLLPHQYFTAEQMRTPMNPHVIGAVRDPYAAGIRGS